jgi:hypothetical protein
MSASKNDTMNPGTPGANPENAAGPAPMKINGFAQVLEMLEVADPAFRESLLRRIAQRDPALAAQLKRDLREQGLSI